MLARLKFKIAPLVSEMLDQLPSDVWINPNTTFLDPAMGGGQFLEHIVQRLRDHGHCSSNIRTRVFGVEANIGRVNFVGMKKLPIQTAVGSFDLDYEEVFGVKKFDVIVGNPPYQAPKGANESKPIWGDFMHHLFDLLNHNGFLALVVPTRWALPKAAKNFWLKHISNNATLLWANMGECSKYFKVGRNANYIGAFVIQNKQKATKHTTIVYPKATVKIDVSKLTFLPIRASSIDFSILFKFLQKGEQVGRWNFQRGNRHMAVNQPKIGFGYRQRGTTYSNVLLIDIEGNRDFGEITSHYTWVSLPNHFHPDGVMSVFNSKIYRWFAWIMIDGDFTPASQTYLTKIPVDKPISEDRIYEYFDITHDEINHIENIVNIVQ